MTDQWTPGPQPTPPAPIPPGLQLSDTWNPATPCAPTGVNSIVDNITITGSPGSITSAGGAGALWSIVLNDGTANGDFRIDRYQNGAVVDSPLTIARATGIVTFHDPVMLAADPTAALQAATKQYVDTRSGAGLTDAPMDNRTYARDMGAWVALPATYMPEAPNTSIRFGRYNSVWQPDAIQTDAPSDGNAYARSGGAWVQAITGGPFLPLSGGTMTGPLTMQGSNMIALNAPLTGGGQAAILGQKATVARWQMMLGDQTAEGAGNAGSNFVLNAFGTTGVMLGAWLSIARADGSTTFNGAGMTIAGNLAVNGLLAVSSLGNFYLPGGAAGQFLQTNGAGVLSWQTAPGGGTISEAPNDGTAYARKSLGWAHLTHTDITDWTATLAPYALIASTVASFNTRTGAVTLTNADVTGALGFTPYNATNPSGYQTAAQVTASLGPYALTANVPVASSTPPVMDGTAAVGTGTTWARADHIHPTDTSRYAASNPSGYQTAAQVTASLGSYLPLAGGIMTGQLGGTSFSAVPGPVYLTANAGTARSIIGRSNITTPSTRWAMSLGDATGEGGSNAGSNFVLSSFTDAGAGLANVMSIVRSTGVCTFSAAIVNGPSDRTLKENIAPLEGSLDRIMALQGVSFNLIATPEKREIGLIAQDVEPIVPEIIQTYTHFDGHERAGDKLALDYPKLTALLIEAVKTLSARVEALEAKLVE